MLDDTETAADGPGGWPGGQAPKRARRGKRKPGGLLEETDTRMKLIASIFGSLAAIATATATVLGVFAQHQATRLRHVTAQASSQASAVNAQRQKIQQQDQQIRQLRASVSATPSPAASGNGPNASVSGGHYLSSANPTVNSQGVNTGQQVGQPVRVSLGHPVSVSVNIKGVTQLGITCAGQDRQTGQADDDFSIALGNAAVS